MDCSLSGSSIHGIFQARVLEWIAISFSRGSSWPRNWTRVSGIAGRRFTVWANREAKYTEIPQQRPRLYTFKLKYIQELLEDWHSKVEIMIFDVKVMSVQFCSVTQSCPTLCDPMDFSRPGFPVHHQFLEIAQTHVHWDSDAIRPSHPVSPPSPPAYNMSQHQGLFQWVSSSHQVAKILEFQLQHQSFQWMFRTDLL